MVSPGRYSYCDATTCYKCKVVECSAITNKENIDIDIPENDTEENDERKINKIRNKFENIRIKNNITSNKKQYEWYRRK